MTTTRFATLNKAHIAILAVCAATFRASFGLAQVQFGGITGLVTDRTNAVVAGASVEVKNQQTGVTNATQSNADGYYTIGSLIPGLYDLIVSMTGFKSSTKSGIKVDVAQIARVNVGLEVGVIIEHVTVKAEVPLLQAESASVSGVIPQSGAVNLPLNGRDYLQLATLVPRAYAAGLTENFSDYRLTTSKSTACAIPPRPTSLFANIQSPAVGRILSASDPREVQCALKFVF